MRCIELNWIALLVHLNGWLYQLWPQKLVDFETYTHTHACKHIQTVFAPIWLLYLIAVPKNWSSRLNDFNLFFDRRKAVIQKSNPLHICMYALECVDVVSFTTNIQTVWLAFNVYKKNNNRKWPTRHSFNGFIVVVCCVGCDSFQFN